MSDKVPSDAVDSLAPRDSDCQTTSHERTQDTMFDGRVSLQQHRKGYRFSVDAVLLAHYAAQYGPFSALDVGTGCGVVPLLLADLWQRHKPADVSVERATPALWALECQASLAALAQDNIDANGRSEQCQLVHADIRDWSWPIDAQKKPRLITCNPPFFQVGAGRVSPNIERAHARHEHAGSLEVLVRAAAQLLHPRGYMALIYPASGCHRLMAAAANARLHVTQLQCIHPTLDADASLLLMTARHRASPMSIKAPLILYQSPSSREYTEAMAAILAGDWLHNA